MSSSSKRVKDIISQYLIERNVVKPVDRRRLLNLIKKADTIGFGGKKYSGAAVSGTGKFIRISMGGGKIKEVPTDSIKSYSLKGSTVILQTK